MTDALTHEALRDDYLLCRTLGHAWYPGSASDRPAPEKGYWWFVIECDRCKTKRVDLISSSGEVDNRHYDYPDGYQITESVTRSQLRQEWERRIDSNALAKRRARRKAS